MRSQVSLRSAALLAAGALAVHDGRFALAYGPRSGRVLVIQGHAYLDWVGPLLVGLLVLGAAGFLARLARPAPDGEPVPRRRLRLWLTATGLLLALYAGQEWAEGLLAAGHPSGLLEPFTHGGWVVFALAPAAGAVIALLLWGADVALARAAGGTPVIPTRRAHARPRPPRAVDPVRRPAIALHLAGRAPPVLPA